MRPFEDAIVLAREEAESRFPDGQYTLKTWQWCDGDYKVAVTCGFSTTEDDNALKREIIVTPHQAKVQLQESTQSACYTVHDEEIIE